MKLMPEEVGLSHVDAEATIKAVRYAEIKARMSKLGLTNKQIEMIETATEDLRTLKDGKTVQALRLTGWTCYRLKQENEDGNIQTLRRLDLIRTGMDGEWYWLSRDGRTWHNSLKDAKLVRNLKEYRTPTGKMKSLGTVSNFRGLDYGQIVKKFRAYDITEMDINTLLSARHHMGDRWIVTSTQPCDHWPDKPVACDQRLMDHGLMYQSQASYWLTSYGVGMRQLIQDSKDSKKPLVLVDSNTERNMDINLGRDGLMSTVSKLWYVWTHGEEIKQKALQKQYQEFIQGQQMIEDAAQMIATSEQRVARLLVEKPIVEQPSTSWTLEMQRAQNDQYWATGGVAFWLNPNIYRDGGFNVAADPCPAPEWWVAPEWKPKYIPLDPNKLLDEALLPPPSLKGDKGEPGLTGPPGMRLISSTAEEISLKRRQKHRDEIAGTVIHAIASVTTVWDEQIDEDSYISDFTADDELETLTIIEDLETYYGINFNTDPFYTGTVGEIIDEMFERITAYEQLNSKKAPIDQVIDYLEQLNGDEHYDYQDWKEEYEVRCFSKGSGRKANPVQVIPKGSGEHFVMVEFQGEVRGFPSKAEAQKWLRLATKAAGIAQDTDRKEFEQATRRAQAKAAEQIKMDQAKVAAQIRMKNHEEANRLRRKAERDKLEAEQKAKMEQESEEFDQEDDDFGYFFS